MVGEKAMPGLTSPGHILHTIREDRSTRFAGVFAAETVERYVFESYAALARTAKVTAHLPTLWSPRPTVRASQDPESGPHETDCRVACSSSTHLMGSASSS